MTYFIVLNILCVISLLNHSREVSKTYLAGVSGLVLILFFGLSYRNGWDWPSYEEIFQISSGGTLNEIIIYSLVNGYEPGYMILNAIIGKLTDDFRVFIAFFSIFTIYLYVTAGKLFTKNVPLLLAVIYSINLIRLESSTLRQGIAVAIVVSALGAAKTGKLRKAQYIVLAASLFHYSAIIFAFLLKYICVSHEKNHYRKMMLASPLIAAISFALYSSVTSVIQINSLDFDLPLAISKLLYYDSLQENLISPQKIIIIIFSFAILLTKYGQIHGAIEKNLLGLQFLLNVALFFLPAVVVQRFEHYLWFGFAVIVVNMMVAALKNIPMFAIILIFLFPNMRLALAFKEENDRIVYIPYVSVMKDQSTSDIMTEERLYRAINAIKPAE